MNAPSDRRGFLRGLVSLPLIGGGVALIGRPAAPVPIVEAMGAPMLGDPRERARYAWQAFSTAMWEVVPADAHGWLISRGGARRAYEPDDAVLRRKWGPAPPRRCLPECLLDPLPARAESLHPGPRRRAAPRHRPVELPRLRIWARRARRARVVAPSLTSDSDDAAATFRQHDEFDVKLRIVLNNHDRLILRIDSNKHDQSKRIVLDCCQVKSTLMSHCHEGDFVVFVEL